VRNGNEVRRSVTSFLIPPIGDETGMMALLVDRVPCKLSMSSEESPHPAISANAMRIYDQGGFPSSWRAYAGALPASSCLK